MPYPAGVYTVIYGTFVEPVLACFVLAAITWKRLPGRGIGRMLIFTGLLLLISGRASMFLLESPWVKQPFPLNYAATSQFLAEWLTAGLLTAATWQRWPIVTSRSSCHLPIGQDSSGQVYETGFGALDCGVILLAIYKSH